MLTRIASRAVAPILFIGFMISPADAIWIDGGVPVAPYEFQDEFPQIVSDGTGGAILAWVRHTEDTDPDILVQKIDAAGRPRWGTTGLVVCSRSNAQSTPVLVSDGAGGAIVAWSDSRYGVGQEDIYAQRIDAAGHPQWTNDGLEVCSASGSQFWPAIVSDAAGGAIIAWVDHRAGNDDIYAQRVTFEGGLYWTSDGTPICQAADAQYDIAMAWDGAYSTIICWMDRRTGGYDLYAQKVGSSGNMLWAANGAAVVTAPSSQQSPSIDRDGTGGAIIAWSDDRTGDRNIYAQRMNGTGVAQWTLNGVQVCGESDEQNTPVVVSDGAEGAFLVWSDRRDQDTDIYAQRIDGTGAKLWNEEDVPVCGAVGLQGGPKMVSDGAGGVIAAWYDGRYQHAVYAQRLDGSGAAMWPKNGILLNTVVLALESQLAEDGAGGALIAWQGCPPVCGIHDIYAQRIDAEGGVASLPPVIHSVEDVRGDEGGKVNLAWDATVYDWLSREIDYYSLWRALPTPLALARRAGDTEVIGSPGELRRDEARPVVRASRVDGATYYWELIGSQSALFLEAYAKVVPTAADSSGATSEYWHYFQVIAHTVDPGVFFVSEPDSGYSVDDLPPAIPTGFNGEYAGGTARLHWDVNSESDLAGYRLYCGTSPGFVPDPGNLVIAQTETDYVDVAGSPFYYKLSAVDVHGNESGWSTLLPAGAVDVPSRPVAFLLDQPPNPSIGGRVTVSFSLPDDGQARLDMLDVGGRCAASREVGSFGAGRHTIDLDAEGRLLPGIYFLRLMQHGQVATVRVAILK